MLALLLSATAYQTPFYGGGWRVRTTSGEVASTLVGTDCLTDERTVWAAVDREPCPLPKDGGLPKFTDRFEPRIKPGVPDAVARLRPQRALIDQLCLSIPRKSSGYTNPEWHEAGGYCVDRLVLAWLAHLHAKGPLSSQRFEDLRVACGGVEKAHFFTRRGFLVLEDELQAIRRDGLVTHQARLPSAIVSYEALSASDIASRGERELYEQILRGLRRMPAPSMVPVS